MADEIVAPGEQIRPQIDLAGAVVLAERVFGIKVESAKELVGYDDKNYHLKFSEINNQYMTKWPHGYVLKIMNSSDSKKLDFVEAQCEMMIHLHKRGICTPQPQLNIHGHFYSVEVIEDKCAEDTKTPPEHVVRLLSYQEGVLMRDVPWSLQTHYQVGRFTAQLDLALQDFFHPAYTDYSSLWLLKNSPEIKNYLFVLSDDKRKSLVQDVIQSFEQNVLVTYDSLQSGMIHGDIHDQNLICCRDEEEESGWKISAVLDLGDSHHSAYVLELALAMTYMMLQSESLESGSHVVCGYCSLHPLPLRELKLLKVSVCARLCQSLLLGLYTHSQHPSNDYVLTTQGPGWRLLNTIWATDSEELEQLWLGPLLQEQLTKL